MSHRGRGIRGVRVIFEPGPTTMFPFNTCFVFSFFFTRTDDFFRKSSKRNLIRNRFTVSMGLSVSIVSFSFLYFFFFVLKIILHDRVKMYNVNNKIYRSVQSKYFHGSRFDFIGRLRAAFSLIQLYVFSSTAVIVFIYFLCFFYVDNFFYFTKSF